MAVKQGARTSTVSGGSMGHTGFSFKEIQSGKWTTLHLGHPVAVENQGSGAAGQLVPSSEAEWASTSSRILRTILTTLLVTTCSSITSAAFSHTHHGCHISSSTPHTLLCSPSCPDLHYVCSCRSNTGSCSVSHSVSVR